MSGESIPAEHRRRAPSALGFAVVTVSDTRALADDASGGRIAELATAAGHRLVDRLLVRDEPPAIRAAVEEALARADVDAVVVTGGTGYAPRDVTVEAVRPLFDRELEGFGELFRALSYAEVGAAAMLSRATAGIVGNPAKVVYLLPGSTAAVVLAMEKLVLPETGHLLGQARRPSSPS